MVNSPLLRSSNLVDLSGLDAAGINEILHTAAWMKKERYRGSELTGASVALLFEKASLRTRTTLELAAVQLGGHAIYLDQQQIGLGIREPVRDVAMGLSRWVNLIAARVHKHNTIVQLAAHATVPVVNALSDESHPLQTLADLLTLQEYFGDLQGLKLTYVGDGNNVLNSLLEAASKVGLLIRVASPKGYDPDPIRMRAAGAELVRDPYEAVLGADAIYTDAWVSMGQEAQREQRLLDFQGFEVSPALLRAAGAEAIFLHCLPAHYGEETTETVVHGPKSRVFDQAENRLHTTKALLRHLLS